MTPTRERDVLKQCLDYLAHRRIFAWRQNQGSVTATYKGKRRFFRFAGQRGISDIIGILPATDGHPAGRFLAVETKAGRNTTTPDQAAFLAAVTNAGGLALCVRSLEDLIAALERADV